MEVEGVSSKKLQEEEGGGEGQLRGGPEESKAWRRLRRSEKSRKSDIVETDQRSALEALLTVALVSFLYGS